jgi:DNA-binding winged helix-turn-helix (wHTH) protein/TolB-like protein
VTAPTDLTVTRRRLVGTPRILPRPAGETQASWPVTRGRCYGEPVSRRVRFGLFDFDPDTGVLHREGVPVRLQPQPGRVLALLVTRAGEVVTRDALRQEVWSDGTFVDFERGLNFCVAQIRSALGDSAESPRFIETLPRRGYRFIAPVSSAPAPAADSGSGQHYSTRAAPRFRDAPAVHAAALAEAASPRSPSGRRRSGAILVVLAVAVAMLVAGARFGGAPADRRLRIAVVPFDNETGMEDFDRIARGVADATVARLATPERVAALSVIGNAAALFQPRRFRDLQQIGTQLDADYIVLAQMKRDAAGVRLIAHLIRVDDQAHVWANTYDRPAFTLDVQSEIAESIASAVAGALRQGASRRT